MGPKIQNPILIIKAPIVPVSLSLSLSESFTLQYDSNPQNSWLYLWCGVEDL